MRICFVGVVLFPYFINAAPASIARINTKLKISMLMKTTAGFQGQCALHAACAVRTHACVWRQSLCWFACKPATLGGRSSFVSCLRGCEHPWGLWHWPAKPVARTVEWQQGEPHAPSFSRIAKLKLVVRTFHTPFKFGCLKANFAEFLEDGWRRGFSLWLDMAGLSNDV